MSKIEAALLTPVAMVLPSFIDFMATSNARIAERESAILEMETRLAYYRMIGDYKSAVMEVQAIREEYAIQQKALSVSSLIVGFAKEKVKQWTSRFVPTNS